MPPPLRLKQRIGSYIILEFVGQHDTTALYLAAHAERGERFWLVRADQQSGPLTEHVPQRELFTVGDETFCVVPIAALSLAALASFVRVFDLAFLGWRWAGLAESLQQYHALGQVYQQENSFALEHFYFNNATQLMPSVSRAASLMNFPAPEPFQSLSTASDVYSLGAAMLVLLGERAPDQTLIRTPAANGPLAQNPALWAVLEKAASADPSQRYPDGHAFASALVKTVPQPRAIKVEVQPVKPARPGRVFSLMDGVLLALGPAVLFIAVVAILFLVLKNSVGLPFDLPSALLNFDPFHRPTVAPAGGPGPRAASSPLPLPPGALAFEDFDLDVATTCIAHLNLALSKGGQPLPADTPIDFTLLANGQPVPKVTFAPGATSRYNTQLIFSAAPLCPSSGTLSVQAKAGAEAQSMTLCYSGPAASEPPPTSTLSASGVQVNTDRYPALRAFFSVADAQGTVIHLPRTVRCALTQDDLPIDDFTFTPVDNAAEPVTVALVFDVSGSMQGPSITNARSAATTFTQQLAANNPVCVYTFSTILTMVQACTTDRKAVSGAIAKIAALGDTALYDALVRVSGTQRKLGGRQVVIVLSDGADTASRATLSDALKQLQQANVPVYAIGLVSKDFTGDVLKQIAATTGASYLEAPTATDLGKLYPLIQGQLRSQYGLQLSSRFPERRNGTLVVRLSNRDTNIEFQYAFVVQKP
jgi:Mg-chelatase subunit ChlD